MPVWEIPVGKTGLTKETLSISTRGVQLAEAMVRTEEMTGIFASSLTNKVNGITSNRYYFLAFCGKTKSVSFSGTDFLYFHAWRDRFINIYREGVNQFGQVIIANIFAELKSGKRIKIANLEFDTTHVVLRKKKFLGANEIREFPWDYVEVTGLANGFRVSAIEGDSFEGECIPAGLNDFAIPVFRRLIDARSAGVLC
jgi:hypothetical protein